MNEIFLIIIGWDNYFIILPGTLNGQVTNVTNKG